jgi:hypothetical protein
VPLHAEVRHDRGMAASRFDRVKMDLSVDERDVLVQGLGQWGGPATLTEELARAIGFESVADFDSQIGRLATELESAAALTRLDWTRVLASAEINFASDVLGTGVEWEIVTPLGDEYSLRILRGLQRKLVGVTVMLGTRPKRD